MTRLPPVPDTLHGRDPRDLSRRAFLRTSALGATGLWLYGCSDVLGPDETPGVLEPTRSPKRVVVVGAGMAGLVAAYELRRAGHDVLTFEARARIGGRVRTIRAPFAPGHIAEAGAARIRPEHDLTLGYARYFGLTTDPFYPTAGLFVDVSAGSRTSIDSVPFRSARPAYVKIRGGTDRLPLAFAAELGGAIRLDTPVAGVRQLPTGVEIDLADGGQVAADRALMTVPLTVLDRITFDPPLSAAKQEATAGGFDYQDATRVFVRFARRFWESDGLNGWAVTDWPEEVWHPTWDLPGPDGVLLTYVRGDRARDLDARSESDRRSTLLLRWEGVFPGVTDEAGAAVTTSWQAEEWSRAAWAQPTPTQDVQLSGEIARAEGPIHFAGEHASTDRGWMQGALASGIRAAREIHES